MILFVCTGNTCRSPMAEALARKMLIEAGIACEVMSAGVSAMAGTKASAHAITVMIEAGCDVSKHQSQPFSHALVEKAKWILTMTRGHRNAIIARCPDAENKTFLLGTTQDVADPFGGSCETYHQCAAQIKSFLPLWIEKIKEEGV